jgi:CubicO group peptidase (beta-lactamase class C family)
MLFVVAGSILGCRPSVEKVSSETEIRRTDGSILSPSQVDQEVEGLMEKGQVPGLALALIREGRPVYIKAYGLRDVEEKLPLQTDTVMYGASLTKLAFAYMVMQLVDERIVSLDRPIGEYLKRPLSQYPKYVDLADEPRWRALTPRMILSHTTGFPNFRFLNPDGKLDLKFEPGTRYAYSGEGYNLLQFVLEEGLGLNVGAEMQKRVFDRFGMTRTSMTWREEFRQNMADGYDADGKVEPHDARANVRAAGSMDTTVSDYAKFLAGFQRGEGLSARSKEEMLRPQIPIMSAHQFPTLDPATDEIANQRIKLASGLGLVLFEGPFGKTFFKGGHDDWTDNLAICVEGSDQCILLLSNSVRAETIFPLLVKAVFGETGLPWTWEYNPAGALPPITEK